MARLVVISDTHGKHKKLTIPNGDFLIHCGDALHRGNSHEALSFSRWMAAQPHAHKIYVPGNHDESTQKADVRNAMRATGIHVLDDCGIEIAGLKFYGSPWTPRFGDWAWMAEDEELAATFASIPVGLDVLITHGPPYGILDEVSRGENVGSCSLLEEVKRKKPRFHVFGHIHEARGYRHCEHTDFLNVASLDENYEELGEPMIIEAFV